MKDKNLLTCSISSGNNVDRASSTGLGTSGLNAVQPPPANAGTSGPPAKPLTPLVSGVHLLDRIGNPLRTLTEAEWRCLHERGGLIELKFTRRGRLLHVILQTGIALATINAALRVGMRDRLPIAADSRTIEIEPGMRTTFRFVRIKAWSPGER